jgi:hypothetical protein
LSSIIEEESTRRIFTGLLNTLKDSARGCLSRRIARRASNSPSEGEGKKDYFLRGLSLREAQKR